MTELKDTLEALMIDLIEARHKANQYSQKISQSYKTGGELAGFSTPAIDIGNVRVDMKYTVETQQTQPKLGADDIAESLNKDLFKSLGTGSLSLKASSATSAVRSDLSKRMAEIVSAYVNPSILKVDRAASSKLVEVLKPHLGRTAKGRAISARNATSALNKVLVDAEKNLIKAQSKLPVDDAKLIAMNVDTNQLKRVNESLVSTLSLDLDLSAMDWVESKAN